MTAMKKQTRPTESELAILNVLWNRGESTVREVHDILGDERGVAYTTLLTQLQVMLEKGYVTRDESRRTHVYRPAMERHDVLDDFLGRFFGGSLSELMLHALSGRKADPKELGEIERLLSEYKESKGKPK